MACLVAAARLFADGEISFLHFFFFWDVEFVVGVKIPTALQKPERAQCCRSASSPGLNASLSVGNDNQTQNDFLRFK